MVTNIIFLVLTLFGRKDEKRDTEEEEEEEKWKERREVLSRKDLEECFEPMCRTWRASSDPMPPPLPEPLDLGLPQQQQQKAL